MPKKSNTNNKEINIEEELKNEILKNQELEENTNYKEVNYKQEKKTYDKEENHNGSLYPYDNLLEDGEIENPRVLIDSLKLQEGVSYKKMKIKDFNSAVNKVIASTYYKKVTKIISDKKYVVNEEKEESIIPLDRLDKESITLHALELRNQCFTYLLGNGNVRRANPAFVKEFNETDLKGTHKNLAYDYDSIDKLVNNFYSEEALYKESISHITSLHFKKVCDGMDFYQITDESGKQKELMGSIIPSMSIDKAIKYINQYRDLKEIHSNRPWHYFITSYRENSDEKDYLRMIYSNIMNVAKDMGFDQEVKDLINAKDRDYEVAKDLLIDKMKVTYKLKEVDSNDLETLEILNKEESEATFENVEDKVETITKTKDENKTLEVIAEVDEDKRQKVSITNEEIEGEEKENVEIENIEINPISDVEDEFHKYPVHGYAMSEKTVYLTEEEYNKEQNIVFEDDDSDFLGK